MIRCFFLILALMALRAAQAQPCDPSFYHVKVEIQPDEFFQEISWVLSDAAHIWNYSSGRCNTRDRLVLEACVPDSVCAVFIISDKGGDGLLPDGYYRIFVNDSLIKQGADYATFESTYMQCGPGEFCTSAIPLDTGVFETPATLEYWGLFTPAITGTYRLNTCTGNQCPTKIWIYDNCENVFITDNQLGSAFYAEGGCDSGAVATLYLAANHPYFLRVGYAKGCPPAPIHMQLRYEGPVRGCMDKTACNYQPLATLADTCYYPNSSNCLQGPDLTVVQEELRNSVLLDTIHNPDQCMIDEGCLRGLGVRHVIRFSTKIQNIGTTDYYIGTPPENPLQPSTQFVWDPCHHHWHYRGYAEYVLKDQYGNIPIGTKNGFCVLDLGCEGGRAKYTCFKMGISAKCSDTYDLDLPCQWIDITGLPAGTYTLAVRVNWTRQADTLGRHEMRYDNNMAQVCFRLGYQGMQPVIDWLNVDCDNYRDCKGVLLGNAVPDCNGVCDGPDQYGDIDKDSLRTYADINQLMERVLQNDTLALPCNDLYGDSVLNVVDMAVLTECVRYAQDPGYWGLRFACHFPVLQDRPSGAGFLYAGKIDTLAKTFDVRILNTVPLSGFEFSVSGLVVDSVKMLKPFQGQLRWNADGKIVGLATGALLQKNQLSTPLLRVYYKTPTAPQVCISHLEAMTGEKYRPVRAVISAIRCTPVPFSVGTEDLSDTPSYFLHVQPNPWHEQTILYIERFQERPLQLRLTDMRGQVVRTWSDVRSSTLEISQEGWPAGVYQLWANDGLQQSVIKMVIH